jgi:uncharacterized protein (TIGR02217 family)
LFDETRISDNYSSVSTGGPEYVDTIVVTASGAEQRNNAHSKPRRTWNLEYAGIQEVADLVVFFRARRGRNRGFRFKDWDDYLIDEDEPVEMVELTSTTFQIQRLYDDGLVETLQDVVKPVDGTVKIWNGVSLIDPGDYEVDYATGIVTFDSDPGYDPLCSCEFDVPVRFDSNQLQVSQGPALRKANVKVVEVFDAS